MIVLSIVTEPMQKTFVARGNTRTDQSTGVVQQIEHRFVAVVHREMNPETNDLDRTRQSEAIDSRAYLRVMFGIIHIGFVLDQELRHGKILLSHRGEQRRFFAWVFPVVLVSVVSRRRFVDEGAVPKENLGHFQSFPRSRRLMIIEHFRSEKTQRRLKGNDVHLIGLSALVQEKIDGQRRGELNGQMQRRVAPAVDTFVQIFSFDVQNSTDLIGVVLENSRAETRQIGLEEIGEH